MMSNRYDDDMFFQAMQIHAVCLDAGIDQDRIRLLTYMHFRFHTAGNEDYFDFEHERDIASILLLLGDEIVIDANVNGSSDPTGLTSLVIDHARKTADLIRNLDTGFRNELGMENRISSELKNRLRLYRDATFRKDMVQLYRDIVKPRMDLYEMATIQRAFNRANEKEALSEL